MVRTALMDKQNPLDATIKTDSDSSVGDLAEEPDEPYVPKISRKPKQAKQQIKKQVKQQVKQKKKPGPKPGTKRKPRSKKVDVETQTDIKLCVLLEGFTQLDSLKQAVDQLHELSQSNQSQSE